MKLRILLVRFWRIVRALWNREVNRGVMAGRLIDIDEDYRKSVDEWNREFHKPADMGFGRGAAERAAAASGGNPAALATYRARAAQTEGAPEITGNPRPVGYEWRYIGGVLHEWKLLDVVHGEYVEEIRGFGGVWTSGVRDFASMEQAMRCAENRCGLAEVPIRK